MICRKYVSICNHSGAILVDSSINRTFSRGYPNLMHAYGGLLEPRGSKLALLKSTFNAENFICRLSWSTSWFRRNSLLKCVWQPQIAKKITKNRYFGVQGRSRSSMLVSPESSSAVIVMICSTYVSICNHSRARLDDSSRNRAYWRGTQIWRICTEDSLNLRGQTLHRWNLRLIPNIPYAGCPGLSWIVSAQFTIKVCIAV